MQQSIFLDPTNDLQRNLSRYGLDPRDWEVFPLSVHRYAARSKELEDLALVGEVTTLRGRWDWSHLRLIEIKGARTLPPSKAI